MYNTHTTISTSKFLYAYINNLIPKYHNSRISVFRYRKLPVIRYNTEIYFDSISVFRYYRKVEIFQFCYFNIQKMTKIEISVIQ